MGAAKISELQGNREEYEKQKKKIERTLEKQEQLIQKNLERSGSDSSARSARKRSSAHRDRASRGSPSSSWQDSASSVESNDRLTLAGIDVGDDGRPAATFVYASGGTGFQTQMISAAGRQLPYSSYTVKSIDPGTCIAILSDPAGAAVTHKLEAGCDSRLATEYRASKALIDFALGSWLARVIEPIPGAPTTESWAMDQHVKIFAQEAASVSSNWGEIANDIPVGVEKLWAASFPAVEGPYITGDLIFLEEPSSPGQHLVGVYLYDNRIMFPHRDTAEIVQLSLDLPEVSSQVRGAVRLLQPSAIATKQYPVSASVKTAARQPTMTLAEQQKVIEDQVRARQKKVLEERARRRSGQR